MKHLSAFELQYIAAELQQLIKAKLSQVYQPSRKQIILQFHIPSKGKSILKVSIPQVVYLATVKEPGSMTGFCSILRRKLNNSTLLAVKQPGFERILQLDFSSKNRVLSLFFELFSKG